ncbi:unnamed protein product, partial [Mycena citricolor]
TNQSPFSLDLGTTVFELSYQNVPLGVGTSANTVIKPGSNTITLLGALQSHTNADDLSVVSGLFTRYLNNEISNVTATGVSTLQSDNSTISWLSVGLQALKLTVPLVSPTPIVPINSIAIGNFDLAFDSSNPWGPVAQSNSITAGLMLPFGFNVEIGQISNKFNISMEDGSPAAGISTPLGASTSQISVYGPTNTTGSVDIVISNTTLACPDPQHQTFSMFNLNLTNEKSTNFRIIGSSRAVASLAIGNLTLDPINVNVS